MISDLVERWRALYGDMDGRPCLVGLNELVGVDSELVIVTSEEYVGVVERGDTIPAHCFITRLDTPRWLIAAVARRLPMPDGQPT